MNLQPDTLANLLSFNTRGISQSKKRKVIFTYCKRKKPDIVLLQETHSTCQTQKQWKEEWGGEIFFSHGKSNARGVCIMFRKGYDFEIIKQVSDTSGRFILLKIKVQGVNYVILNLHAPNDESKAVSFFKKLNLILREEGIDPSANLIIGGDFNCPLNPLLDKNKCTISDRRKHPLIESVKNLMEDFDLQDIWRIKNPRTKSFTWGNFGKGQFSRIDYWLISSSLQDVVKEVDIVSGVKSDHSGIILSLINEECEKRGPGFWIFNSSLLDDEQYVLEVNALITDLNTKRQENQFETEGNHWEWVKYNIRKHAMSYSKKKANSQRRETNDVERNLAFAKKRYEENPSLENEIELFNLSQRYEKILERKTNGIILRTKVRWFEEGEKSSKYFLNLEKRNNVKKCIKNLTVNGIVISKQKDIIQAEEEFYKSLYSKSCSVNSSQRNIKEFTLYSELPQLSEQLRDICEGEIEGKECDEILKTFKKGKSPGTDGITIEFYEKFWDLLKPLLLESYQNSYKLNNLTVTQRQSVITLIDKKQADRTKLENWRPISLLNTDYKILSKVIAERIKKVLPFLVNENQVGYVKNRYIGEVIRTIDDVMDFTDEQNLPGLMVLIDFEKAFDTVDRSFIINLLDMYGFGPSLKRWVQLFFANNLACVCNNGFSSQYFPIERGVKQGDPLSPYLFILAAEILAISIRKNPMIQGIEIDKEKFKIAQFADDTTIFLSNPKSVKLLIDTLDKFEILSGLKINLAKTEALWLGSLKKSTQNPFGITCSPCVKVLGIHFSYNKKLAEERNFNKILPEMRQIINLWKTRNLTLFGKVTIIKSLILSKLTYKGSMLCVPPNVIAQVKNIIFKFLWHGPDKIKRNVIYNDYKKGGLRMMNIENMIMSLKLTWISRLLTKDSKPWKKYIQTKLEKVGGYEFFLKCNYDLARIKDLKLNSFYTELFQNWLKLKDVTGVTLPNEGFIWNNKDMCIANNTVFYKHFFDIGIRSILDLFPVSSSTSVEEAFRYWNDKGLKNNQLNLFKFAFLRSLALKRKKAATTVGTNSICIGKNSVQVKTYDGKYKDISCLKAKDYYNLLSMTSVLHEFSKRSNKLKTDFHLSNADLGTAFSLPYKVTQETKLREIQYKILNHIIGTNYFLRKVNIKECDLCDFCKEETESVYHLFYECGVVSRFWNLFETYWAEKTKTKITLTLQDVVLGNARFSDSLNYCILLAKQFIFNAKYNNFDPRFEKFKSILKKRHEVERITYSNKNKLKDFEKRWIFVP